MAKKAKKAVKKKVAKKAAPKKVMAAPKKVVAVPTDVPQLTPYFSVTDAGRAIEFYKQVFGAKVKSVMSGPDGKVGHASLRVGNALLMLAEHMNPNYQQGRSSSVMLYVKDTDAVVQKVVSLGARTVAPVADMFWGDRWGMFEDPFGNVWQIATHIEDVKPAEMAKRIAQMAANPPPGMGAGTPPPPPHDATTSEHIAQA